MEVHSVQLKGAALLRSFPPPFQDQVLGLKAKGIKACLMGAAQVTVPVLRYGFGLPWFWAAVKPSPRHRHRSALARLKLRVYVRHADKRASAPAKAADPPSLAGTQKASAHTTPAHAPLRGSGGGGQRSSEPTRR